MTVASLLISSFMTTGCVMIDRHVSRGTASVRAGQWSDRKYLMGSELHGKTLAIIGLGRIGKEVASRMQAFGMTVSLLISSAIILILCSIC